MKSEPTSVSPETESLEKRIVNKQQAIDARKWIAFWKHSHALSASQADALRATVVVHKFDYAQLSKHTAVIAIACLFYVCGSVINEDWFYSAQDYFLSLFHVTPFPYAYGFLACVCFAWASYLHLQRRNTKHSVNQYTSAGLLLVGLASSAWVLWYIHKWGAREYDVLFAYLSDYTCVIHLFGHILFGMIGVVTHSNMVWFASLFSFVSWLQQYLAPDSHVLPWLYSLLYGFALIIIAHGMDYYCQCHDKRNHNAEVRTHHWPLFTCTFMMGLIQVFFSLASLASFGSELADLLPANAYWTAYWTFLLLFHSIYAMVWGAWRDNTMARYFGLVFTSMSLSLLYDRGYTVGSLMFAALGLCAWRVSWSAEEMRIKQTGRHKKGKNAMQLYGLTIIEK